MNTTHINIERCVPYDLFPSRENKYTKQWAESTFRYCHLFVPSINYEQIKGNGDVEIWQQKALEIRNDLNNYGNEIGKEYLLNVATKRFNLRFSGHEAVPPTSIEDVVNIFGNKEFYKNDVTMRRQQLYSLMYGIYRNGDNMWVLKGEQDKLNQYRILYEEVTKAVKPGYRQRRGCFYQIMKVNFSQSTTRKFQQMMEQNHGEYLASRKKYIKKGQDMRVITKINVSRASVWLVKTRNDPEENLSPEEILMKQGMAWTKKCEDLGLTVSDVTDKIRQWMSHKHENDNYETNSGTYTRHVTKYSSNVDMTINMVLFCVLDNPSDLNSDLDQDLETTKEFFHDDKESIRTISSTPKTCK